MPELGRALSAESGQCLLRKLRPHKVRGSPFVPGEQVVKARISYSGWGLSPGQRGSATNPPSPRRSCAQALRIEDEKSRRKKKSAFPRMSFLWEQNGKLQGQEDEFWRQAGRELQGADERGDPAKGSPDDS